MKNNFTQVEETFTKYIKSAEFHRILFTGLRAISAKNGDILKRIELRPIDLKGNIKIQINQISEKNNKFENLEPARIKLKEYLLIGFNHLIIEGRDYIYDFKDLNNGEFLVTKNKSLKTEDVNLTHDHKKIRVLKSNSKYLQKLDITDDKGNIKRNKADKFKQIEEFVKLAIPSIQRVLAKNEKVSILDCGSGSSYLTFALAAYCNEEKIDFNISGIDIRKDLVDKSNALAKELEFDKKVEFRQGTIKSILSHSNLEFDILVALHACDTATDEALMIGIKKEIQELLVAPCCQKSINEKISKIRPENKYSIITSLLDEGILTQRFSDLITDELRILILRASGYRSDAIEFISSEHTPRNILIRATRDRKSSKEDALVKLSPLLDEFQGVLQIKPPLLEFLSE